MQEKDLTKFLLEFDGAVIDDGTDENVSLFRISSEKGESGPIFASIEKNTKPTRLELRCDRLLAKVLRERYETVVPARHFNQSEWNCLILTGQIPDDEVKDFARLSYNLTVEKSTEN